jgi:hypothetical protein
VPNPTSSLQFSIPLSNSTQNSNNSITPQSNSPHNNSSPTPTTTTPIKYWTVHHQISFHITKISIKTNKTLSNAESIWGNPSRTLPHPIVIYYFHNMNKSRVRLQGKYKSMKPIMSIGKNHIPQILAK